jgi:predicted Zn-dependent protease
VARALSWPLSHAATAWAAAGDTAQLATLVDSLTRLHVLESYVRGRRLHHHARGLLLRARGRDAEAAVELRRAIWSPTVGYTRTNLELGRVLVRLGRPREAAAVLAPALRGDLESNNYYVTHTELHEALGQAFDAAGQRDSAAAHYAWVAAAWSAGDAAFRQRAAAARRRAAALRMP